MSTIFSASDIDGSSFNIHYQSYFLQFTQGVSVTVERRYSQFEWLYERLLNKFGALILPPLPEKQYTGITSYPRTIMHVYWAHVKKKPKNPPMHQPRDFLSSSNQ